MVFESGPSRINRPEEDEARLERLAYNEGDRDALKRLIQLQSRQFNRVLDQEVIDMAVDGYDQAMELLKETGLFDPDNPMPGDIMPPSQREVLRRLVHGLNEKQHEAVKAMKWPLVIVMPITTLGAYEEVFRNPDRIDGLDADVFSGYGAISDMIIKQEEIDGIDVLAFTEFDDDDERLVDLDLNLIRHSIQEWKVYIVDAAIWPESEVFNDDPNLWYGARYINFRRFCEKNDLQGMDIRKYCLLLMYHMLRGEKFEFDKYMPNYWAFGDYSSFDEEMGAMTILDELHDEYANPRFAGQDIRGDQQFTIAETEGFIREGLIEPNSERMHYVISWIDSYAVDLDDDFEGVVGHDIHRFQYDNFKEQEPSHLQQVFMTRSAHNPGIEKGTFFLNARFRMCIELKELE